MVVTIRHADAGVARRLRLATLLGTIVLAGGVSAQTSPAGVDKPGSGSPIEPICSVTHSKDRKHCQTVCSNGGIDGNRTKSTSEWYRCPTPVPVPKPTQGPSPKSKSTP